MLVVDDDQDLRESLQRLLIVSGFDALPASDGVEALDLLDRRRIDALIVDLQMPRLDGVGLIRALVARPAPVRPAVVFLITAYLQVEPGALGIEVAAVFLKPFDPLELLARLRGSLDARARA